jgi:hypothetical protein
MRFLYSIACEPGHFEEWGHDLLGMFATIAVTSSNRELRRMAWSMGHERALAWRSLHPHPPPGADAEEVFELMAGSDAAERLGVSDGGMRRELRAAAARFTAIDYYGFDPAAESPPADIPNECGQCSIQNARGARRCARCGQALTFRSRYGVWLDALIGTYTADRYGVTLGAHYLDVLHWLPAMRPYPQAGQAGHYEATYAITHVIYTLNDYSANRLSPDCLPDEFDFLHTNLPASIDRHNPEAVGEYLDTLGAFGLTLADSTVRSGVEYLLSAQNPDGSWGDRASPDAYRRYHPTWTAIDGLREYRWGKMLPCVEP